MANDPAFSPFRDFPAAAEDALRFLHARLGFDIWTVARKRENELTLLRVEGNSFPLRAGDSYPWFDTICSRMVAGRGPNIAHRLSLVTDYVNAPIASQLGVQAYAGFPLVDAERSVFGVVAAYSHAPQNATVDAQAPLLAMMARLLSTIVVADMREMDDALRMEHMRVESLTDPATGLGNRRYWTHLLAAEESRCRREDERSSVIMLDVDANGSEMTNPEVLRKAAYRLRSESRAHDVVARLGGNSLGMLAVGCSRANAEAAAGRITSALISDGLSAAIGVAAGRPAATLESAWRDAEEAMNQARRSGRKPRTTGARDVGEVAHKAS